MKKSLMLGLALLAQGALACGDDDMMDHDAPEVGEAHDPATADVVSVDRFAKGVGMLQVRTADNGLPGANEPVDFDQGPFITQGFTPDGAVVRYYNFDVQPLAPAPIYVLFRDGEDMPVEGQLNIIDVIPGDAGYNDFWNVVKVTVPDDYVANQLASAQAVRDAGYAMEATTTIVNCPVVPEGSTAKKRLKGESAGTVRGWYKDKLVHYLNFGEAPLSAQNGKVPVSPIFVTFNVNPDQDGGGPGSGFEMEEGSPQTHNVVATLPGQPGYSPLWSVSVYDNADFAKVADLATATQAKLLAAGVANVNCPVVEYP
jgi:hypothetical protein